MFAGPAEHEPETEFSGIWGKWQAGYNPQNAQARTAHLEASIAWIDAKLHARATFSVLDASHDGEQALGTACLTNCSHEALYDKLWKYLYDSLDDWVHNCMCNCLHVALYDKL